MPGCPASSATPAEIVPNKFLRLLFDPSLVLLSRLIPVSVLGKWNILHNSPGWGEVSPVVLCELGRGQRSSSKWDRVLFAKAAWTGGRQRAPHLLLYQVGVLVVVSWHSSWKATSASLHRKWRKTGSHCAFWSLTLKVLDHEIIWITLNSYVHSSIFLWINAYSYDW